MFSLEISFMLLVSWVAKLLIKKRESEREKERGRHIKNPRFKNWEEFNVENWVKNFGVEKDWVLRISKKGDQGNIGFS